MFWYEPGLICMLSQAESTAKMEPDAFESYWNRSSGKAFSFDDVDDDGGSLGTPNAGGSEGKWDILNDDTISEASFDNGAFGSALNLLSIKSVVSEDVLNVILNEQTLDDRVSVTKGMTPDEELKLLRRQIQTTLYHPSTEVTAHKLLQGKAVHLEVFKSLHEKEELLDAVLVNGGGDPVVGVLLFLKKTLNRTNFYKILRQRPKAFAHYLSYLKANKANWSGAAELLQMFGKKQENALLQFQLALSCNDLPRRKQNLRQLLERCSGKENGIPSLYQQIFHANLKLLELLEQERNTLDHLVPANATPIEVLYACCRKHVNWKEQDLVRTTSPFRLCAEQQISPSQFEWTALNERTTAQAYADLESVFERIPTWHPMKQKQFHISFSLEAAIWRLYQLQAPSPVLYLFLSKMNNANERLELAQRVKCTKAIIDAFAALKDVAQLMQMRDTLPERSEEQFHCDKALKALQSKRWSTDNIKLKL